MKNSTKPHFKVVYYTNNPETGYFTKNVKQAEKTSVMRLPYQLKVEKTQLTQIKCNAERIIRGKEKYKTNSNNYKFFTGLQETEFSNWFLGNDYEFIRGEKVLSLVLFHFSNENEILSVYYFGRYFIEQSAKRRQFVKQIITQILNT